MTCFSHFQNIQRVFGRTLEKIENMFSSCFSCTSFVSVQRFGLLQYDLGWMFDPSDTPTSVAQDRTFISARAG